MAVIDPFDFEKIFVVIVAGSPEIFTAMFLILISAMGAYFRFENRVMMIMYLIAGIVMSFYMGVFYVLIILIAGIITFYSIMRMFNR